MATQNSVFTPEVIARINAPIHEAGGLPAAAYTSDEFFTDEQLQLFPQSWMGIAFDTDFAQIGDARPMTVCGRPLILVRTDAQTIRAFHNVCRHRATLVLTEPAQGVKQFQCPYHAWTYGLDGTLQATPFWDGTANSSKCPVDPAKNSLVQVPCSVWNHVVYINLDGNAAPLDEYAAAFARRYAHVDLDSSALLHRRGWEFNANWKLVMDNWEVYHHVWVHEGVFDKMSDEVDLKTGEPYTDTLAEGNVLTLSGKAKRPPRFIKDPLPKLPLHEDVEPFPGGANALLPNTTLTISPTSYAPAIYVPVAAGVTRCEMAWYVAPQAIEDEQYASAREGLLNRWLGSSRDFNDRGGIRSQDHSCMEWQQAARGSHVADDVKYSATWEQGVHYFQRWVVAKMTNSPLPG
jgi:choline monooxygenase